LGRGNQITSLEVITEDFDSAAGFVQTDPDIYIADGQVHWTVHRDGGDQFVYRSIPSFSGDVRVTVLGQVDSANNNCYVHAGVGDSMGHGVAVRYGWFGGGCPNSGYLIHAAGVELDMVSDGCSYTPDGALWVEPSTPYVATLTITDSVRLSVPGVGSLAGKPVYTGTYETLYVGLGAGTDWPSCSGTIDRMVIEPLPARVYLPVVVRGWPPIPEAPALYAIDNADGDGSFWLDWSAPERATSYVLEEAAKAFVPSDGDFAGVGDYDGTSTYHAVSGRGASRYHYRVKARNGWGDSGWSNVASVDVLVEGEPNDVAATQANGPIVSGLTYYGRFPSGADEKDYFAFEMPTAHTVEVLLTNIPSGQDYDLALYDEGLNRLAWSNEAGNVYEHLLTEVLPVGRYYVQVINFGMAGSPTWYQLRVFYADGVHANGGDQP
jgi:hypothetical protein